MNRTFGYFVDFHAGEHLDPTRAEEINLDCDHFDYTALLQETHNFKARALSLNIDWMKTKNF